MYSQPRSSSSGSSMVSWLIMPRSATMHTLVTPNRARSRSTTGTSVLTSAVLPGQDGEEDGPLEGEPEAAPPQPWADGAPAAGGLPEPLEDQGRADVPDRDGRQPALGVLGDEQNRTGQPSAGGEQRVELAGLLELIEPAEVATTRWRERPPSQRFSTTWR